MSEESSKSRGVTGDQESQHYGTFQGVANYYHPPSHQPPAQPVVGFPQPLPPPGVTGHPRYPHVHYPHAYQTVPGYAVVEGHPVREHRLPCCGLGMGWFLSVVLEHSVSETGEFLIGFFLGGIPWYVGAFILLCVRVDYREKPGYVACMIAAILAIIAVTLGVTKGTHACESFFFSIRTGQPSAECYRTTIQDDEKESMKLLLICGLDAVLTSLQVHAIDSGCGLGVIQWMISTFNLDYPEY
ncbi:60S ribosomal protein L18a-1 [Morus notabilis]|uniref:60S ribosomal protein L18a-1 n=1 Tax=Morus notabilis TaxID=981085 RepID=W9SER6_9ROSA|nr:60S ribosomal protein L18a-1 [Morus notabilis]